MANVMTTIGNAGSSGVTVTSGAVVSLANDFGFTATQLVNAERALITATKAAVRYRYDGVAPTTEVGHLLPMDAAPPLEVLGNVNLKAMQFILDAGAAVESIVLVTLEW
ncbi:MAG: hypothetical protein BWY63_02902 [Chloroflexi bacterium ADurb.Bin360]|nr:MAG: hypothetical protein BWY63_02902 [Chloroflexi bacterium ADurb.Bin360]